MDLFGHTNTAPSALPRNPEEGFAEFWAAYPSEKNRRVGKPQALKKWIAHGWAAQAKHIIAHVHHMKTEDCWVRGFHPLVLTYLNQQRWLDWEPVQAPARPAIDPALAKLAQDAAMAAKPSAEVRAKMAELLKRG